MPITKSTSFTNNSSTHQNPHESSFDQPVNLLIENPLINLRIMSADQFKEII